MMSITGDRLSDYIQNRKLLNCDEVASLLNVSRSFVYLLLKRGDIPAVYLGRAVRVRPSDLEQYIKMNTNNETNSQ